MSENRSNKEQVERPKKCNIIEKLNMSIDEDFIRANVIISEVDQDNFQLEVENQRRNKDDILYFLKDPKNDKLCGFMKVRYIYDLDGRIDAVSILILTSRSFKDVSYKDERIGTVLIKELIDDVKRDSRINFITIENVNFDLDAHKFYKKMGFRFVGRSGRPLMILKKRPSLNRFLFIDGKYPESDGYEDEKIKEILTEKYASIDKKVDPEGNSSIIYDNVDFEGVIYCRNYEKRDLDFLISFIFKQFQGKIISEELKNLLMNDYIFNRLMRKAYAEKDYQTFKRMMYYKFEMPKEINNVYLPPYVPNDIHFELDDLLHNFKKEDILELFFQILPENIDKMRFVMNVGVSNPHFNTIEDLISKRWEVSDTQTKKDMNLAILALYFYEDKEIVEKALSEIKDKDLKSKLERELGLKRLKLAYNFGEINNRDEKWDFVMHSTPFLSVNTFKKIIWEDQALLPNMDNKLMWIEFIKESVVRNKNLSTQVREIVKTFNENTPLIETFIQYPFLREIFNGEVTKELFENNLHFPAVYSQYIFQDLDFEGREWNYQNNKVIFLFDSRVLKDFPYVVCEGVAYGRCMFDELREGFYGTGSLQDKPDMREVQRMINERILTTKEKNKEKVAYFLNILREEELKEERNEDIIEEIQNEIETYSSGYYLYQFSNEILFDELRITDLKAILTTDEDYYHKINDIVSPLNKPVFYINDEDMNFKRLFLDLGFGYNLS